MVTKVFSVDSNLYSYTRICCPENIRNIELDLFVVYGIVENLFDFFSLVFENDNVYNNRVVKDLFVCSNRWQYVQVFKDNGVVSGCVVFNKVKWRTDTCNENSIYFKEFYFNFYINFYTFLKVVFNFFRISCFFLNFFNVWVNFYDLVKRCDHLENWYIVVFFLEILIFFKECKCVFGREDLLNLCRVNGNIFFHVDNRVNVKYRSKNYSDKVYWFSNNVLLVFNKVIVFFLYLNIF